MGLRIEVRLDKENYAPGEEIEGQIDVLEGDAARSTSVSVWRAEVTSDYTDVVASHPVGTVHTGDLTTGMSIPFTATVPADARPNVIHRGSLIWQVVVEVDRRGFNKGAEQPFGVVPPSREEPIGSPPGSTPITAGGKGDAPGRGWRRALTLGCLVVVGVAAFLGVQKVMEHDDPVLPAGAALDRELEQRFGETSWFGHITSIEGDRPDPGDLSIDTSLQHNDKTTEIVRRMCDPLRDYLASYGAESGTVHIHSDEDPYVAGRIVLGISWSCDDDGLSTY